MTLEKAQRRYADVSAELRHALPGDVETIARELNGLRRMIKWLRERGAA